MRNPILILLLVSFRISVAQNASESPPAQAPSYSLEEYRPGKWPRFIEYRNKVNDVKGAQKMTYYGVDLTYLVLTDHEKFGQEEDLKRYILPWALEFNNKVDANKISKFFSRYNSAFQLKTSINTTADINKNKTGDWISLDAFELPTSKLMNHVESYDLKETEGVGFVIIAENFNKETARASVFYTFFDIRTREILWAVKIKMAPVGVGMTNYWVGGMVDCWIEFKQHVYPGKM